MTDQDMVALLRRVRHDFGNHLQVISGYLQIGKPEQALQYLEGVVQEMNAERIVFNLPGEASLYFYEQIMRAYDAGIRIQYQDIEINSWELLKNNGEPFQSLMVYQSQTRPVSDESIVYISIKEDEQGFDLLFSSQNTDSDNFMIRLKKE